MHTLILKHLGRYFRPRLLEAVQGYDKSRFTTDLTAGITVGIIALPLAAVHADVKALCARFPMYQDRM